MYFFPITKNDVNCLCFSPVKFRGFESRDTFERKKGLFIHKIVG